MRIYVYVEAPTQLTQSTQTDPPTHRPTFVLAELGRELDGAVQALAVVLEEGRGDPLRHVAVLALVREERLAQRQERVL
jgi:hypothetical protein